MTSFMLTETIGYMASLCISIGLIPQLYKTYQSKHTRDIEIKMPLLIGFGSGLFTIYGILLHSYPIIITNAIAFGSNICLIIFCLIYKD